MNHIRPALLSTITLTLILGVVYPLLVTGLARVLFPHEAAGSLVRAADGTVIGSRLIGQAFPAADCFHSRPSASTYDASASGGTNLGPTSRVLIEGRVRADVARVRSEDGVDLVPVDLVTSSASGLDPDITPASAFVQAGRVARERGLPVESVKALVRSHVRGRQFGVLGEPRVNVLELNLALDQAARTP